MNQEKIIQTNPPSICTLLYADPSLANTTIKDTTKSIEKSAIDEFLYLSKVYLELDKNS